MLGADLSGCRSVFRRCRFVWVPNCLEFYWCTFVGGNVYVYQGKPSIETIYFDTFNADSTLIILGVKTVVIKRGSMDTCHQLVTRNPEASIIINEQNCEYVTPFKDSSTKHEIESMLNSTDQTASLDKDLTGIYHYLVHSSTQEGIRLLYWMDSEKLVWLYELVRCLDNDTGHGIRIKMMVVDVMHEREKVNKTIVMSQAVLVDKGGQSHVPHDSPVPSPSAYSRQEIESDVDQS